ncbi:hypothetical protein ABPG75_012010 [Micractinium tetrahymenae]
MPTCGNDCLPCWSAQVASAQTVTAGADSQAKLVRHTCRYSAAYARLLLPHWADDRVASLLGLLTGWGTADDGMQLEGAAPLSYLQLLTALVEAAGRGVEAARRGGGGLPPALAELLAAACGSIAASIAALEVDAWQKMSAKQQVSGRGRPLLPAELEDAIRPWLPTDAMYAAIAAVGGLSPCVPELLKHSHRHCMPLLVGMLQVELLARLPPAGQRPLAALGCLLQHRHVLGRSLHASLTGMLTPGASDTSKLQMLQLVSTAKAALRCTQVACASGLQPEGFPPGAGVLRSFAADTVLWRPAGYSAPSAAELLWLLVMQQAESVCSLAARKACDILLCMLGQPALAAALLQPAAAEALVAQVAAQLDAALAAPRSMRGGDLDALDGLPGTAAAAAAAAGSDASKLAAATQHPGSAAAAQALPVTGSVEGSARSRGGAVEEKQQLLERLKQLRAAKQAALAAAAPAVMQEVRVSALAPAFGSRSGAPEHALFVPPVPAAQVAAGVPPVPGTRVLSTESPRLPSLLQPAVDDGRSDMEVDGGLAAMEH